MSALESLDPFLARVPEDRTLTRRVRRHLHAFQSLAVVGPPDAARALVLRLVETLPLGNVHALVHDGRERRVGSRVGEALAWRGAEVDAVGALRSFLRQDPDAVAATELAPSGLEMIFNALCTGHLALFGAPAQDLAGLDALLAAPELAAFAGMCPAALVLDASGKLVELMRREGSTWTPLPDVPPAPVAPRPEPTWSPPPPATSARARRSWIPQTERGARTPHRLASRSALLPPGGWPTCTDCGRPKQHVLQLTASALPEPWTRSPHVIQLFICEQGCDLTSDPGPTLAAFPEAAVAETAHPEGERDGLGGGVTGWLERLEEPHPEDAQRSGDDDAPWPWNCDKLGGWPRWEQGPEWPEHGGARMELLFQIAEAGFYTPGRPAGWDDARAELIPGTPRTPRLEPSSPVHLPGALSGGDGCAWVFRSTVDPAVLRFLWQTS